MGSESSIVDPISMLQVDQYGLQIFYQGCPIGGQYGDWIFYWGCPIGALLQMDQYGL